VAIVSSSNGVMAEPRDDDSSLARFPSGSRYGGGGGGGGGGGAADAPSSVDAELILRSYVTAAAHAGAVWMHAGCAYPRQASAAKT